MEMFKRSACIEVTFIAASGGGPQSFADAVAGRVPVAIGALLAGQGFGKLFIEPSHESIHPQAPARGPVDAHQDLPYVQWRTDRPERK